MSEPHVRSFTDPDEVIEARLVRSEVVSLAGLTVSRDVHSPGWRWSVDVKPLVGTESCQVRHVGYAIKGRLRVRLQDESEYEVEAGDVYHIPPEHDAWVVGDEPFEVVEWMGVRGWITPLGALAGRVLSTLVFTDIVDSTGTASRLGDRAWRELIGVYEARIKDTLAWYRGQEVKQTGDGVLATFDGAARAIHCALELRRVALDLGLPTRASVHTGEVELAQDDIHGLAVHEASRMLDFATPGEIIVSSATRALAADDGLVFEDRGEYPLRGIEGLRHLYAVTESGGVPR